MNTEENRKTLYIIGACAWLMRDLLSHAPNVNMLRALKESMPSADYVALASLHASKIDEACKKYEKAITNDASMREHYPALSKSELDTEKQAIIEQFALSADYLYNWLSVAFKVPSGRFADVDKAIADAIEEQLGTRKKDIDLVLEWASTYPKGYTMSLQTIINKCIEIKNRQ